MNKLNLISRKTVDILNTPINLTAIVHSIFCNVKEFLGFGKLNEINELGINPQLISDEELGLPANGVFSPKFGELLKEIIDKKL